MNSAKEAIQSYIATFQKMPHPQLAIIDKESEKYDDLQPSVGLDAGNLLNILVRLVNAQRVVEFGTALGYSTICLGTALQKTGGKLTSVELREDLCNATRRHVTAAGLQDCVEVICGDALEVANQLDGPFDLVLQDSAKGLYPKMLERCIQLTRKGGLIVADDALFVPMGIPEKFSKPIHQYNEMVFRDPRLLSTLLPIGDGMLLSYKI